MLTAKQFDKLPHGVIARPPGKAIPFFQPKLTVNQPGDVYEQEADAMADKVMQQKGIPAQEHFFQPADSSIQRKDAIQNVTTENGAATDYLEKVSGGQVLSKEERSFFEPRMGYDFSNVKIHTDSKAAESARSVNALAYTSGNDIVFNQNQFSPGTDDGKRLLAHELTHVVQQGSNQKSETPTVQRTIEMRDVGKGEASGLARLPELIKRLNDVSGSLIFFMEGQNLKYTVNPYGDLSNFDQQMMDFIDDTDNVIPLRITNRSGALGSSTVGYTVQVSADDFNSGYVDIDDLLAAEDVNLQTLLVHLIAERAATTNYNSRMGRLADPQRGFIYNIPEFNRAHDKGLAAELNILRDFFKDPSIVLLSEPSGGLVDRIYRNSRNDRIMERHIAKGGIDTFTTEVHTHDGRIMTADAYKALLASTP